MLLLQKRLSFFNSFGFAFWVPPQFDRVFIAFSSQGGHLNERSIARPVFPLFSLFVTAVSLCAVSSPFKVIIYASFGLDYFEDGFTYDADYEDDADDVVGPNPRGCHSVVSCFWLIM